MGGLSKRTTVTSQKLPTVTAAPIPGVPMVATDLDAAQIEANNADVKSLIGRDVTGLRKRQDAYSRYLGTNKNNLPTILGQ